MILSLKYLFAAHNFVIIFLVLIVLLLSFDIGRNKKSGIKITNKEITCFSGKFIAKNIYQIFSMLNSKKDWIYLTNLGW
jgi:hypothetical protein